MENKTEKIYKSARIKYECVNDAINGTPKMSIMANIVNLFASHKYGVAQINCTKNP